MQEQVMKIERRATALPTENDETSVQAPELSVIVPTFNERDNVAEVVQRLEASLSGNAWEVIFVDDDSPDGTAARAREIARTNPSVRCLQRIGRRGLSSACVEGMLASSAPYLAVMDADCQHDESGLSLSPLADELTTFCPCPLFS
jgi:dolichol-phosphate mannosyltransferase